MSNMNTVYKISNWEYYHYTSRILSLGLHERNWEYLFRQFIYLQAETKHIKMQLNYIKSRAYSQKGLLKANIK